MRCFPKDDVSADIHHDFHGMIVSEEPCWGCRQQAPACKAFFALLLHQLRKKDNEVHRMTQATQLWTHLEDNLELVAFGLALAVVAKAW